MTKALRSKLPPKAHEVASHLQVSLACALAKIERLYLPAIRLGTLEA